MERILIFYQSLIDGDSHTLWVHLEQLVNELKQEDDIQTTYPRFFYHLETKSRLDENLSWKENHVVSGDHIIYV